MTTPARPSARSFSTVAAVLGYFLAAASAPSPLYAVYAREWHFSTVTLTVVFAVYALALLLALLCAGTLSDTFGRRPVIIGSLALEAASMALFLVADGVSWLYAARVAQGLATGVATAALSAALLDLQPPDRPGRGPLTGAVMPSFGLAVGALGTGTLVQWAPAPTRLVYAALTAAALVLIGLMLTCPAPRQARSPLDLRPRVSVEPAARAAFAAALPCLVATWALGGLYLSLGPSLALTVGHSRNHLLGGSVIVALTVAAGVACLAVRSWPGPRAMLFGCTLLVVGVAATAVAVGVVSLWGLFAGTVVAGAGFGTAFFGAFRSLAAAVSPAGRGGLVAAIYVASYLSFALPAIVAGVLTTHLGLRPTAVGSAIVIAVLSASALVARALLERRGSPPPVGSRA